MTIEHKRNVEERAEIPNYQVKAGSTLAEICEEFGISHASIIIDANPKVFESFSEAKRAGDPKLIQLEENTELKIPKLEIGMVRAARGVDYEGKVQPYVFQLRDPSMAVPVSDAMARRQGRWNWPCPPIWTSRSSMVKPQHKSRIFLSIRSPSSAATARPICSLPLWRQAFP